LATTTVLFDGPVPKHVQLRELLERSVREELGADAPIGSERALMRRHGVSRATVREAIGQLVSTGLLYRVQGKGTFVAAARVDTPLHLASFTEDMVRRGLEPSTCVLEVTLTVPPALAASALGLASDEPAWRLERLRIAGGQPMALELGWFPHSLLPRLDSHDLTRSVYALLARTYGLVIDTAQQTTWAQSADPRQGELLGLATGAPLLALHRTSSAGPLTVETTTSWYRGDRYQVHTSLERRRHRSQLAT